MLPTYFWVSFYVVKRRVVAHDGTGAGHNFFCPFYPTALKDCRGIVFTHGVRMGGRACPGYISETVRCRKLILGRDFG